MVLIYITLSFRTLLNQPFLAISPFYNSKGKIVINRSIPQYRIRGMKRLIEIDRLIGMERTIQIERLIKMEIL